MHFFFRFVLPLSLSTPHKICKFKLLIKRRMSTKKIYMQRVIIMSLSKFKLHSIKNWISKSWKQIIKIVHAWLSFKSVSMRSLKFITWFHFSSYYREDCWVDYFHLMDFLKLFSGWLNWEGGGRRWKKKKIYF